MEYISRKSFIVPVLLIISLILSGCDDVSSAFGQFGESWPPRLGEPYPDLEFTNYDGRKVRLSDFKGKVILVEPVGMTCQACNAFAGAHVRGTFQGIRPQPGLKSIEEYMRERLNGLTVDNSDLVLVQLILYDLFMDAPDIEDARIWAEHFGLDGNPNIYVLFSERDLRGKTSFDMIPGFQLVDRNSVVRADSTGHQPRHNLFAELLPMIPKVLNE
jgi:hypothetical protein